MNDRQTAAFIRRADAGPDSMSLVVVVVVGDHALAVVDHIADWTPRSVIFPGRLLPVDCSARAVSRIRINAETGAREVIAPAAVVVLVDFARAAILVAPDHRRAMV